MLGRVPPSVDHRRQPSPLGLVVEPHRHQRHHLGDAEPSAETPADHVPVTRGHEHARPRDGLGAADECLEVVVRLGDRVAEVGDRVA